MLEVQPLATADATSTVATSVGGGGATNLVLPVPLDPVLRGRYVFIQGVTLRPGNPVPSLTPGGDACLR